MRWLVFTRMVERSRVALLRDLLASTELRAGVWRKRS